MDSSTTAAAPLLSPTSFNHCASLSLSLSEVSPKSELAFLFPRWCGDCWPPLPPRARRRVRKLPTPALCSYSHTGSTALLGYSASRAIADSDLLLLLLPALALVRFRPEILLPPSFELCGTKMRWIR